MCSLRMIYHDVWYHSNWIHIINVVLDGYLYVIIINVYRFSFQISRKCKFSQQIFEKAKSIKFYENLSSGTEFCRAYKQTRIVTKLRVAFRSFAKPPNERKTARSISTETEQIRPSTVYSTYHKMYICIYIIYTEHSWQVK